MNPVRVRASSLRLWKHGGNQEMTWFLLQHILTSPWRGERTKAGRLYVNEVLEGLNRAGLEADGDEWDIPSFVSCTEQKANIVWGMTSTSPPVRTYNRQTQGAPGCLQSVESRRHWGRKLLRPLRCTITKHHTPVFTLKAFLVASFPFLIKLPWTTDDISNQCSLLVAMVAKQRKQLNVME